ncbi:MAG TPA: AAA family ATPase [Anaerolineae bacterium]|nr:AAA family ATPase [Anaerolineae bacterium]
MTTFPQLFLQMSGTPGAGKTTLANALRPHLNAVILDHDTTKSAFLAEPDIFPSAGPASYIALKAIATHLVSQGHTIIFDSPCFYTELLTFGQQLAHHHHIPYKYIECYLDDFDQLEHRLQTRQSRPSQLITHLDQTITNGLGQQMSGRDHLRNWSQNMKRPHNTPYLRLDTSAPPHHCLQQALTYLATPSTPSRHSE